MKLLDLQFFLYFLLLLSQFSIFRTCVWFNTSFNFLYLGFSLSLCLLDDFSNLYFQLLIFLFKFSLKSLNDLLQTFNSWTLLFPKLSGDWLGLSFFSSNFLSQSFYLLISTFDVALKWRWSLVLSLDLLLQWLHFLWVLLLLISSSLFNSILLFNLCHFQLLILQGFLYSN
jgi:hypothetical protein